MTTPTTVNQSNATISNTPTLLGNVVAGSLIMNNSSVDTIYVSPYTNVSPTTGLRIGPLGSLTWTVTSPLWAITDNTDPVNITISSSASNPSDPLSVAEALVSEGIPSTRITTNFGTYTVADYSTLQLTDPRLTQSSTLNVFIYGLPNNSTNEIVLNWYNDATSGPAGVQAPWSLDINPVADGAGTSSPTTLYIPVKGSVLFIDGSSSLSFNITIVGDNSQTSKPYNGFIYNRGATLGFNGTQTTLKTPLMGNSGLSLVSLVVSIPGTTLIDFVVNVGIHYVASSVFTKINPYISGNISVYWTGLMVIPVEGCEVAIGFASAPPVNSQFEVDITSV